MTRTSTCTDRCKKKEKKRKEKTHCNTSSPCFYEYVHMEVFRCLQKVCELLI